MSVKSIAFFTTSLKRGGAERVVSILSNNLINQYDVTIILLKGDIEFQISSAIKIVNLDFTFNNIIKSLRLFNKTIKINRVEKLITFLYKPSFIAILAKIFFGWKLDLLVSERTYTLSHYNKNTFKGIFGLFLVKSLYKKADLILPNSKLTAHSLKNDLKLSTPIIVLYNPVDLVKTKSLVKYTNSSKLKILNVANNFWYKNQRMLIQALFLLKEYEWELTIIGSGPLNVELRRLVENSGIKDKISFLENVNAFDYYLNYDLFISTSLIEGFPNSIVEAMMSGLAIIATDCKSGPREILAPKSPLIDTLNGLDQSLYSEYGVLIPVNDHQILAETIKCFLLDSSLLERYKSVSKIRAQDFSVEKTIKNFKKILEYESSCY